MSRRPAPPGETPPETPPEGAAAAAATDYKQLYRSMKTPQLISEAWDHDVDPKMRDQIITIMMDRERRLGVEGGGDEAWPSAPMAAREEMAGLYPDPADPQFAARLFAKREFYEARALAAGVANGSVNMCTSQAVNKLFELTPVQRIVSRFLHPLTPYQGLLLFHGVGVGKTCSAVTIAEQFLESAPSQKVIVLVPQALKENFKNTVFDPSDITWDAEAGQWTSQQCTGTSYLERLGLLENPDLKAVTFKVEEDKRARYTVTGYAAFANWIERTLEKRIPIGLKDVAARRALEDDILRQLFSDHLIIVDEAHNLRDTTEDGPGASDAVATGEAAENAGGKKLNPLLKRIVLNAEGLRMVLMTATPMYNSAPEIVLLLNYLLMNDSKKETSQMRIADLFSKDGFLNPGPAQRALEKAARRYVSYMRGENPYTFPLRMRPAVAAEDAASLWPAVSATKRDVDFTEEEAAAVSALPLVFTEPVPDSPCERLLRGGSREEAEGGELKISDAMLDLRMQMANISYSNGTYGTPGWDTVFASQVQLGGPQRLRVFTPKAGFDVDSVFQGEGLRFHAPKIHRVVESIKSARGICFAYSRYIKAGALPMAIALERAGFQRRMADGRLAPLLVGAPAVRPVCALCGSTDGAAHSGDHEFKPACYVLLTSQEEFSPMFKGLVKQASTWREDPVDGPLGARVKVILGSQVASEGLDLKCVREMHVLDSWYHLNRTEQIIGRAIRFRSHAGLCCPDGSTPSVETRLGLPAMSLNNCLVYLHALHVPDVEGGLPGFETADMYAYRIAIGKARAVGQVQRLLKKNAWDCNLELEAISFIDLPPRVQIDAQGRRQEEYSINDQDYTTYCDYAVCEHKCAVTVVAEGLHLDSSTFRVEDARRLVLAKQSLVRAFFKDQVMVPETTVRDVFSDLPWEIASEALMELLDGRRFRLSRDGLEGFLIKKAGYLVFQPSAITDLDIPLSMRYARAFQLQRRFMETRLPVLLRGEMRPPALALTLASASAPGPTGNSSASASVPASSASSASYTAWKQWVSFVDGAGPLPAGELPMWSWLMARYAGIPEARMVALTWWIEKHLNSADLGAAFELVIRGSADADLTAVLMPHILRSKDLNVYRIYNPSDMVVEYYCLDPASGAFKTCDSGIKAAAEREFARRQGPLERASLLGFYAAKAGKLVFKTFDMTKPKTPSAVGAECGNTSNLQQHQPLIVDHLHPVGLTDADLAPLMLPDDGDLKLKAGEKKNPNAPTHLKDITHQPLCLYIEFLTRLFDTRKIQGRRWFFDAVTASIAGLKGRK